MAHRDVDLKSLPRRRIVAVVVVQDRQKRVQLVKPRYDNKRWQLPAGGLHRGEAIADGAACELKEETGLVREIQSLLALDQVPAGEKAAEGFNAVCDGGILDDDEADAVAVPAGAVDELEACKWVWPSHLDDHCAPYQARRIREALDAAQCGYELPLLVRGRRAGA